MPLIRWTIITFLLPLGIMSYAESHATPPTTEQRSLMAQYARADDECRGRPDAASEACALRQWTSRRMYQFGWFVTIQGVWYSRQDVDAFFRAARVAGENVEPALTFGKLDSLVPLAYQQLRQAGLSDAQIISIWKQHREALREVNYPGYAVMAQLMPYISRAHYNDRNPIYDLDSDA